MYEKKLNNWNKFWLGVTIITIFDMNYILEPQYWTDDRRIMESKIFGRFSVSSRYRRENDFNRSNVRSSTMQHGYNWRINGFL